VEIPTGKRACPLALTAALLVFTILGPLGCSGEGGGGDAGGAVGGAGEAGAPAGPLEDPTLRFGPGGTFRIVQFTDTQDGQEIDPRAVRLMEAVLDGHRPNLVVFTGDNIRSGPSTADEARRAMDNIVRPVEERGIPWLVAFGNHDEDQTPSTGMDEAALLDYYMSFPNNLNRPDPAGVHGTGNVHVLIRGGVDQEPRFNVWALDSGRYSPDTIAGQSLEADGLRSYDWIRSSQVAWYVRTSEELEARYGRGIPALMFFHIPLPEFALMWEHRDRHGVVGEKNEDVAAGAFNSGLFAALQQRGDVRGVFVGHDHVNDFVGDYFGIRLGYSANTGFGTYGLDGEEPDRMRGARVFVIEEERPEDFETFMVYARDLGIQ
jgi:3',5'-cyclic AMP phosphodiesterase CpdA